MKGIMSKIHLELLDKKRQAIFYQLSSFKKDGYLAGGTALALQINHRRSVDFDIFVDKPISKSFKLKVKKIFGAVDFYINSSDQISFNTKDGVGVTFVWYYYPRIASLVSTDSIGLASVFDIAADKAETLSRRAVWRDYVDLFFLLKWKILTLGQIIKLAKKKFKGEFVETQFLEQLPYFADLQKTPIEFIEEKYTDDEIKSFLEKEVEAYIKKILPR
jgi:hypothetical protein